MSDGPPEWFDRYHSYSRPEGSDEMLHFTGEIVGGSTRAVQFYDGRRTVWLPLSKIKIVDGGVDCPEWLAKRNGMA